MSAHREDLMQENGFDLDFMNLLNNISSDHLCLCGTLYKFMVSPIGLYNITKCMTICKYQI